MKRRTIVATATAVLLGAAAFALTTRDRPSAANAAPTTTAADETAKVTRTDLIDEAKLNGTLGYGDETPLGTNGRGTITALPEPGTVLHFGDSLWQVDGHAGPALLDGTLPMWRALHAGIDQGADVQELEQGLTDLGFGADLTVDQKWDSHTTAAVKAWQDSRGLKKTGVIDVGDVVFIDHPVRVAELKARIGDQVGPSVMTVTGSEQSVTLDVGITKLSLLHVGDAVKVQLPDDSRVDGTVASVGRVATVKQDGSSASVSVAVSLAAPVADLDAAPVQVIVTTKKATGVLVVPVRALLALAEGGYAVERVEGSTTRLVAVEPGVFGDGVVAITGDGVKDGDSVVVAR